MNTPRPSGTPLKEGTSAPIDRISFERAQRLPSREGRTRSAGVCFQQNTVFSHSLSRSQLPDALVATSVSEWNLTFSAAEKLHPHIQPKEELRRHLVHHLRPPAEILQH